MSQVSCLDKLIRRIDRPDFESTGAERMVMIDTKTRKATTRKPLFGTVEYYLVKNTNDARNQAECTMDPLVIQDFSNDRCIGLCITYRVSCEPDQENNVAEALCTVNPPRAALEQKISKWTNEFLQKLEGGEGKFIDQYYEQLEPLRKYLRDTSKEIGLNFDARFSLENHNRLETMSIRDRHFPIRLADSDEEFDLLISLDLEVNPEREIQALLAYNRLPQLEQTVLSQIREYCAAEVTVHQYFQGLDRDYLDSGDRRSHKEILITRLNENLNEEGRCLGKFQLSSNSAELKVKEFYEAEISISCELQEYPEPIRIANKVQLGLKNLGKYHRQGTPHLDSWLHKSLQRIIHSTIFKAKYLDLLLRFDASEKKIKKKMRRAVDDIGYSLQHLITVPDLEPLKWKESFILETGDETYGTKVARVDVGLRTIVTGRIPDLLKIEDILNRREDFLGLMTESIREQVANFLHDVDPERFYMRFEYSDRQDDMPVELELKERIRKCLSEKYHAQISSVIIKRLDTELVVRLLDLQKTLGTFQIKVSPFHGFEPITLYGQFQVVAVDQNGWYTFQLRECSLSEIGTFIEAQINEEMATLEPDLLAYREAEHHARLKFHINKMLQDVVAHQFGVVVEIVGFSRHRTESEDQLARARAEHEKAQLLDIEHSNEEIKHRQLISKNMQMMANKAKQDELQGLISLYQQEALADHADMEEVSEIKERIDTLTKELGSSTFDDQGKRLDELEKRIKSKDKHNDLQARLDMALGKKYSDNLLENQSKPNSSEIDNLESGQTIDSSGADYDD